MGDNNNNTLKITVCKSINNKYSLRKDGYLFWTGIISDDWVTEDNNKLWETDDRELVSVLEQLVNYSQNKNKSVKQVLLKII